MIGNRYNQIDYTLCYISALFPCLCFLVNVMCLCLDLFVSVVNYVHVQTVMEHLFHWTSTDINTKIKLILLQNYGWPTGPAKIWLWLARRPFGWPRASGKHDPWTRDAQGFFKLVIFTL